MNSCHLPSQANYLDQTEEVRPDQGINERSGGPALRDAPCSHAVCGGLLLLSAVRYFVEETSARIVNKSLVASARNVASSVLISLPKSAAGSAWCLIVVEHAVTEYFVAPTITAFTACSPLAWIL